MPDGPWAACWASHGIPENSDLSPKITSWGQEGAIFQSWDSRSRRWGAEESVREREQWRPMRSTQLAEGGADAGADVASARVVDIEDIEDFLVELGAQPALTHYINCQRRRTCSQPSEKLCNMLCCLKNLPCGLSAEQTLMHDDYIHSIHQPSQVCCIHCLPWHRALH